jgi:outer membrane protein OmpA-like peptidoglycan-associated protein
MMQPLLTPSGRWPARARAATLLGAGALALLAGCASEAPVVVAPAAPVPPVLASQTAGYSVSAARPTVATAAPAPKSPWAQLEADLTAAAQTSGVQMESQAGGGLLLRAGGDAAFGSGKAQLSPGFKAFLQELARQMQAQPGLKASISGHTDSVGSAKANERLSAARARAVQHELATQGVAAPRLTAEGKGAREAIAGNDSAEGRAANRRVDIVLAAD